MLTSTINHVKGLYLFCFRKAKDHWFSANAYVAAVCKIAARNGTSETASVSSSEASKSVSQNDSVALTNAILAAGNRVANRRFRRHPLGSRGRFGMKRVEPLFPKGCRRSRAKANGVIWEIWVHIFVRSSSPVPPTSWSSAEPTARLCSAGEPLRR